MMSGIFGAWRLQVVLASFVVVALAAGFSPSTASPGPAQEPQPGLSEPYLLASTGGEPVEVVAERTETDTVFANPDGTTTREIHAAPVRAFNGEVWKDVDTDLAVAADGSIQPKVLTDRVVLSPGGTGPLIVSEVEGITTSVSWPDPLPAPNLQGNVATYPQVFGGVDLRVAVSDVGTSTVLVVEDEQAAALVEAAELHLPYTVSGGSLETLDNGALVILDEFDREVAAAGAPVMWDSAGQVFDSAGTELDDETAEALAERTLGPAEGDRVEEIGIVIDEDSIVLAPPAEALVGEDVEYPVFIDPTISRTPIGRAMVSSAFPGTSYANWSGTEGVGYQNYERPYMTKRLMWRFNTASINGATIRSAQFSAVRTHAATCQSSQLRVFELLSFSLSTTWNNQPAWASARYQSQVFDAAGRAGCSPGDKRLEWNVTKGAQRVANVNKGHINLGLKTYSESTPGHWRRFKPNATLSITYSFPPDKPSGMKHVSPNRTCNSSQPMGPDIPRLQVTLRDRDAGEQVRPHFQLFRGAGTSGQKIWDQQGSYVPSGSNYLTLTTNTYNLPRDASGRPLAGTYTWRVRAIDNSKAGSGGANLIGPWSATCTFTIDPDAPLEPEVTPAHDDPWVYGDSSTDRSFALAPNENEDDPDAHVYRWSVNDIEPRHQVSAHVSTRTATIASVAAGQVGRNVLRVWAEDHAGNRSAPAVYEFDAIWTGTADAVRYRFDLPAGDPVPAAAQNTGGAHPGLDLLLPSGQWSLRGDYSDGTEDWDDYGAAFDTGDAPALTTGPAVDPDNSFMVSAWLDPAATTEDMYAVSQLADDGTPAFRLGVESGCGGASGWCFAFGVYDAQESTYATARIPATDYDEFDVRPQFTHVVGEFDAAGGTVRLRVREGGTWQESTAEVSGQVPAASPSAPLVVGAMSTGSVGAYGWRGRVDDLRLVRGRTDEGTLTQIFLDEEKPYNLCFGTECD